MSTLQKSGLVYLYLMPAMVAAVGFGIGPVSHVVYLPLWVLNSCLVLLVLRQLVIVKSVAERKQIKGWLGAGILLIVPWMLFSVFAGMGPPPATMADWLADATEQEVRYSILMIGGICTLMGFALLKTKLHEEGEQRYAVLGFAVLSVSIPLFILNMAFWGYYLSNVFRIFINLPLGKRPDWYAPVKTFFDVISVVEMLLTYLATLLFAIAMRKINLLSIRGSRWYVFMSVFAMVLVVLPPSSAEPFGTLSYLAAIPAIPFIMPYLMGLRLICRNYALSRRCVSQSGMPL